MKKKFQLILSFTIFILIIIGYLGFEALVQKFITDGIREQVVKDNRIIGEEILQFLQHNLPEGDEDIVISGIQSFADEIKLPNDGFICAMNGEGHLLAAPGLKPGETMNLGITDVNDFNTGKEGKSLLLSRDSVFEGEIRYKNGSITNIIASLPVGKGDLRLNVHQDNQAIVNRAKELVSPLIPLGLVFALIISVVGYFVVDRIIRGYESRIERQNQIISAKNREVLSSIRYARMIQRAILPSRQSIQDHFKDSFILQSPKDIVSGDFFWIDEAEQKICFSVIDCTGHGVPGAMLTMVGNSLLEQAFHEYHLTKPSMILSFVASRFYQTFSHHHKGAVMTDGMDMALCLYDKETRVLEYAGARRPVLVLKNNELLHFKPTKRSIGPPVPDEKNLFESQSFQLEKGDRIYLFTDGFADQFGGDTNKKFLMGKFKNLILETGKLPMKSQYEKLTAAFMLWKGNNDQTDDVMVLGVEV